MKLAKLLIVGGVLSLGAALAASNSLRLADNLWLGQTQLKPGNYKVQVEGNKVTLTMGKTVVEVPGKVEQNATKYQTTEYTTEKVNGKLSLQEIDLGGTNSKIVVESGSAVSAGTK